MANVLVAPSAVIGLMGAQRRQNSLLPFPIQADPLDEMMFQRAPNGYVEGAGGQYFAADRSGQTPMAQQASATPQRERVSGWRVLDRVLGGQTISEGLDAERARLQAQALQPQQQARIQAALGAITDPREQALFLGLGGEDWQKNVAQQYAPQVIGAGGIQSVIGNGRMVGAPSVGEFGDRVRVTDPVSRQTTYSDPRPPSYQEATARINATNPVSVAQDATLVDPYTGRTIAQGVQRPDIQNVAPGGEALAFDAAGNIINRVGSTQERPLSASDQKAIDDADVNVTRLTSSVNRARQIQQQIATGQLNLGPLTNAISGARNAIGQSDANSLNYDALLAWAKAARNAALAANTGVQTDQDAIRELDTILSGVKDERVVTAALQRYIDLQGQTAEAIQRGVQRRMGGRSGSAGGNVPPPPPGFELDR